MSDKTWYMDDILLALKILQRNDLEVREIYVCNDQFQEMKDVYRLPETEDGGLSMITHPCTRYTYITLRNKDLK